MSAPLTDFAERCEECGFSYAGHDRAMLPDELHAAAEVVAKRLTAGEPHEDWLKRLRWRPAPDVWSALEYACHVRDVLLMQRERLFLAQVEEGPVFKPMYRDERVALDGYNEQTPADVASAISVAAGLFRGAVLPFDHGAWQRTCEYAFPNPAKRNLLWVVVHTLHEMRHHLFDIDRDLAAAGS